MSNQHDNIYNILGKLDALTPKQAPVEQTSAKTVNESVEARGSVLAGVARVEARLAQQFAEANDWNNLGAEFRTTKPGTREPTHTGEKEYTKTGVRHHASKRYGGERSDDAETTSSTGEKRGRGRPKKSQFEEEQLDELSPDTLNSYADKAKGQRSHAFGRMVAAQQGNQAADPTGEFAKTWDKRATGYNKAVAKGANDLDKSGTRSTWNYDHDMDEEQVDEISDKNNKYKKKKVGESINFAEMMKEQHQTVDEYLMELQADIAEFKKSGRMTDKLRDSVEMHKFSKKQLTDAAKQPALNPPAPAPKPPGMMQRAGSAIAHGAKAVAGAVNKVVGHPSDAEMLDKLKRDTMKEELDELARLAGLSESLKGGQKKLDKNKNGKLDSEDFKMLRDKVSEATVDEDMIKSKKDDDKKDDKDMEEGNEFSGALDAARDAGEKEFEVDGKTYPVKEAKMPMKTVDGKKVPAFAADGKGKNDLEKEKVDECGPEMSPFSSMGHEEAESGMSINSSMDTKTGRKTLSVTADGAAAEELAQMLKMAGMGGHSHDEPKTVVIQAGPEEAVEEEREGQYANTPDEEVENIDSIMHQGNDLNREKEQYSTDRGRDNAMAIRREGIEMPKSLSRMLEAIKMVEAEKCNHTAKGEKCPVHGLKECGGMYEAKPSAGMSKGEKSSLAKKAQAGGDIGKPGKSFDKLAKAAGGGEKGKRIAAAAMWKNAAK